MSKINKEEGKPEEEEKDALEGTGTDGAAAVTPNAENTAAKEGEPAEEQKEDEEEEKPEEEEAEKEEDEEEEKPEETQKAVSKSLLKKMAKTEKALEKAQLEKRAVAARLAQVEKALAVEKDARILKQFTEDAARDYVHIGKAADLAVVLKEASEKLSATSYSNLTTFLKAANARIGEGLFAEIGKSGAAPGGSVVDQIRGIAKSLIEKNADLTMAQAEAKAWEMNPELYSKYQAARRAGHEL